MITKADIYQYYNEAKEISLFLHYVRKLGKLDDINEDPHYINCREELAKLSGLEQPIKLTQTQEKTSQVLEEIGGIDFDCDSENKECSELISDFELGSDADLKEIVSCVDQLSSCVIGQIFPNDTNDGLVL